MHGAEVDVSNWFIVKKPPKMHMQYLQSLVSLLDTCVTCRGHPNSQFVDMVEAKERPPHVKIFKMCFKIG